MTPQATKQAVDWGTVAKLFGGGALLGGGAGAVTSYLRHMEALKHDLAKQTDTSEDDDVLYVELPADRMKKKAAQDETSGATFALGSLGALLGAMAAYNGVRRFYNGNRKKDLQAQLDAAQHLHVDKLQEVAGKQASFPALSVASGTVGLTALLTALGTAAVANRTLNKQFPVVRPPDRDKPRRVVLRQKPAEAAEAEVPDEVPPEAAADVTPDGREAMLRAVLQTPNKSAAYNWSDVVAAVAQGRGPEIEQLCMAGMPTAVFDVCQGASQVKTANVDNHLAVAWLAREPMVARALEPAMAAAVSELGGSDLIKFAASLDPQVEQQLVKLAELGAQAVRCVSFRKVTLPAVKEAMVDDLLAARMLQKMLAPGSAETGEGAAGGSDDGLEPLRNQPSSKGTSTSSEDAPNMPLLEVQDEEAQKFLAKHQADLQAAL